MRKTLIFAAVVGFVMGAAFILRRNSGRDA